MTYRPFSQSNFNKGRVVNRPHRPQLEEVEQSPGVTSKLVDDAATYFKLSSSILHCSPEVQLSYIREYYLLAIRLSPQLSGEELEKLIRLILQANKERLTPEFKASLSEYISIESDETQLHIHESSFGALKVK